VEGAVVQAPGEGEDKGRHLLRVEARFEGDDVLRERREGGGREGGCSCICKK